MCYEINSAYAKLMGSIYAPNLTGSVYFYSVEDGTKIQMILGHSHRVIQVIV